MNAALVIGTVFAYIGGIGFTAYGLYLTVQRRRLHPLLLLCISAISFSWIEAPYDWAVYAQFPPDLPRMPGWWPMNMTWGGLPSAVPVGYIAYFVLPTFIATLIAVRLIGRRWGRPPFVLLTTGLIFGFLWALVFNAGFGARIGVFHYGRVIPDLALFEGTRHQYPIYDAIAMGIQVAVFTYLLGRADDRGRDIFNAWTEKRVEGSFGRILLPVAGVIVLGHVVYGAVFAPHLVTKLAGWVTVEAGSGELFPGVPNQPLHGGESYRVR